MLILSCGNLGIGKTSPQGKIYAHDVTVDFIFVTKTGLVNVAQTLIPDGTGDVTKEITSFFVCDSGDAVMSKFQSTPGANVDVAVGGFALRLVVTAGGAFTAVRIGGTGTATLAILAVWI